MFSTASIPGVASSSLPDYNFPSLDEYDELLADILGEFDLGIPGISGGNSSGDDPFPNYEDIIEGILKEPSSQVSLRNVFFGRWHSEKSLFPNICGLPLLLFFWLKWAGYLAVAGLNLLAQISDRISPFGV